MTYYIFVVVNNCWMSFDLKRNVKFAVCLVRIVVHSVTLQYVSNCFILPLHIMSPNIWF